MIEYIVIHDTANPNVGANAEAHFNYFNGGNRQASADFFVDGDGVWKVNDFYNYYTWHCGDGRGQYGITNRNSIGIEMCINSDGKYGCMFERTLELVKDLMSELNIPLNKVVRHYDASRKDCPGTFMQNNWERWEQFKSRIQKNDVGAGGTLMSREAKLQKHLNILGYGLVVDGIVGPLTRQAVTDFQRFFNLLVDGIAGPQTNAKLQEVLVRRNQQRPPFRRD